MNEKRLRFLVRRAGVPISIPSPLPQPRRKQYGTSALNKFTNLGTPGINGGYTRQSYLDEFGVEAPAFDPDRPIQSWFDSTAKPGIPYVYNVLGRSLVGLPVLSKKTMAGADARTVNLTGAPAYPPYVIEPTNAYQETGDGTHASINVENLCLKPEAEDLMAEWEALGLVCHDLLEQQSADFPYVYPPEEDRRVWYFTCDGAGSTGIIYPGIEIANENSAGVGHPGKWDLSMMAEQGPMWVPDPDPPSTPPDPNNVIAMPLRDLLDNETLILASAGMAVMVERTDM